GGRDDGGGDGEVERRQHVVRDPGGELRERVRGGRRDDERVEAARELDVADRLVVREIPGIGQDLPRGEGLKGQRGDEPLSVRGHQHVDLGASRGQSPDVLARLVGGEAAADAERHAHRSTYSAVGTAGSAGSGCVPSHSSTTRAATSSWAMTVALVDCESTRGIAPIWSCSA